MDQAALVTEEIDAGAELVRRFSQYLPVNIAFWLKTPDEERHYLYLASDRIDDTNFDVAYGEVLRVSGQMTTLYLDPFQVRVVSADHPLARAAIDIFTRFPSPMATRLRGTMFGGRYVDEVYIYPTLSPATVS